MRLGGERLIITQKDLIRKMSKKLNTDMETVRKFLETEEEAILDYLSSVPLSEKVTVKILNGFSIKRDFIKSKMCTKGMFNNHNSDEHVIVKCHITRHYNDKLNEILKTKGKENES